MDRKIELAETPELVWQNTLKNTLQNSLRTDCSGTLSIYFGQFAGLGRVIAWEVAKQFAIFG